MSRQSGRRLRPLVHHPSPGLRAAQVFGAAVGPAEEAAVAEEAVAEEAAAEVVAAGAVAAAEAVGPSAA